MISKLIEIFATVADVLFLIWFVPKFNGSSLKKRPLALIWAVALLVFQLFADRYLQNFFLVYAIVDFGLALAFSLSLVKNKKLWHAFGAFVYVIVVMLSNTFVYTVFSLFIDGVDVILQDSTLHIRIVYLLACKIVHFAFYRLILMIFKKDQILDVRNGILSFIFTIMTATGLGILMKTAIDYELEGFAVVILTLSFILIALNIILYTMIYQVQILMKNKYELSLMRERIESEKSRTEEASAIWEKIRKLKHDLKNHFTVLKGKLDDGNVESCKKYLSELNQTVDSMGNLIKSGNSVIDYIINTKLSHLDGVRVLISGYVDNYSDIDDVDLACILGNVIDNAIEAQESVEVMKHIELSFLKKNSNRIIICKNTVSGSVLKNNKQLKTTKKRKDSHGLGHQIVEETVKKYGGMVDYFEEDDIFGVEIILPV